MKLKGKINGVPILIFVDNRTTHNFISQKLVATMGWEVEETKDLRIKLGDGHLVVARGTCKGVEIELGGITVTVDTSLFDLEDVDVVLGISWLAMLGEMLVD